MTRVAQRNGDCARLTHESASLPSQIKNFILGYTKTRAKLGNLFILRSGEKEEIAAGRREAAPIFIRCFSGQRSESNRYWRANLGAFKGLRWGSWTSSVALSGPLGAR